MRNPKILIIEKLNETLDVIKIRKHHDLTLKKFIEFRK